MRRPDNDAYRRHQKRFMKQYGAITPETEKMALYVAVFASKRQFSAHHQAKYAMIDLCIQNGIDPSPLQAIQTYQSSKVIDHKLLEREELQILFDHTPSQLSLMMAFLYETGLRIESCLSLRVSDMKRAGNKYYVQYVGKNKKQGTVSIRKETYEAVLKQAGKEYLFENRNATRYSRNAFSNKIRYWSNKLLNRNVSPHQFRHSMASHLVKNGVDIRSVQQRLNHSDVKITIQFYLHTSVEEKDLQQLMAF